MKPLQRFSLAVHALNELGAGQLWHYARYRLMLGTGMLRLQTRRERLVSHPDAYRLNQRPLFTLPDPVEIAALIGTDGIQQLSQQADQVISGQVNLFGGSPVPLSLQPPNPLLHWTAYENEQVADPKPAWEAARFGWGITLARAYYLLQEERYADAFWKYTELFLAANPPYQGVNWVSAQEAALRLVAWTFCLSVLAGSKHSTPHRMAGLGRAIAAHAQRIPPTLSYARAQNNNHLLSEAVGLYTASLVLPDHPAAPTWRTMGWRMANAGFQSQISAEGSYVQHSANYHRLVLQLALWVQALVHAQGQVLPTDLLKRLAAATGWLSCLVDGESGRVPNLGPNDGAYFLPLTNCPFHDYRPVLQAASIAFLGQAKFPAGAWDEMSRWLVTPPAGGQPGSYHQSATHTDPAQQPHRLDNAASSSWAYLRAASFTSRPGHADQLHLDLWWRGLNLAQDAGTYLYNDPPPWNNALSRSAVHNTLTINGLDQMTHAGRFLWLDWAHARLAGCNRAEDDSWQELVAQHDGYRRLGLTHQRTVRSITSGGWLIKDEILPAQAQPVKNSPLTARLHWLLPDWPWQIEVEPNSCAVRLTSPHGVVALHLSCDALPPNSSMPSFSLARAGAPLFGSETVAVTRGWVSPTYAHKIPALSLAMVISAAPPITITSAWELPT